MTHLAYVDVSNLFIEGQKVGAVIKGMARGLEDAKARSVIDLGYRLDLHRLTALLQRAGEGVGEPRAGVFGSVTSSNQGLSHHAGGRRRRLHTSGGANHGRQLWEDGAVPAQDRQSALTWRES